MNAIINRYFDAVETRLLQSPIIVVYEILSREVSLVDGKLRVKASLQDNGLLEFFAYINEAREHINLIKYSFHWQGEHGKLIKRWDNAPHHPHLFNAPHHVHHEDGSVDGIADIPDVFFVMGEIEQTFQR